MEEETKLKDFLISSSAINETERQDYEKIKVRIFFLKTFLK